MKFLTLEQIKAQCRIEEDFTMEDSKLTLYGDSAEQVIFNMCQRPYEDFIETYGAIPQDVVHAALLLVTASYEHRSAVSMQNLSIVHYSFDTLIKTLSPQLRLTVAADITSPEELIKTRTVAEWRKCGVADIAKRPTIFILGI